MIIIEVKFYFLTPLELNLLNGFKVIGRTLFENIINTLFYCQVVHTVVVFSFFSDFVL